MTTFSLHIGLNDYTSLSARGVRGSFRNLFGCEEDALQWKLFSQKHLEIAEHCQESLTGEAVTKANVIEAISKLADLMSDSDRCLITYSGHGIQVPSYDSSTAEPDGIDECLVTSDFTWEDPLRDNELGRLIDLIPRNCFCTLVIDTCHSGSITRAGLRSEADLLLVRSAIPPDDIARALLIAQFAENRTDSKSGFGPENSRSNLCFFAACQSGQQAREIYFEKKFRGAFSVAIQHAITMLGMPSPNESIHALAQTKLFSLGAIQECQLEATPAVRESSFWLV